MREDDRWASGEKYEPFIGRWSRPVASRFVTWLAPVPGGDWLDVGCGTGALSQTILDRANPGILRGIDPSDGFIAYVRDRIDDRRARFSIGRAGSIRAAAASFDFVVSGLVMNFVSEPESALVDMRRVTRPGGCVAAYVWDYSEGMQMLRVFWDAVVELDPDAVSFHEGRRFPLCNPRVLEDLWLKSGLADVRVTAIDIPTVFSDFDDYWLPFLGSAGTAPAYVAGLDPERRASLEELLRKRLATYGKGPIDLTARAWAVMGLVN